MASFTEMNMLLLLLFSLVDEEKRPAWDSTPRLAIKAGVQRTVCGSNKTEQDSKADVDRYMEWEEKKW